MIKIFEPHERLKDVDAIYMSKHYPNHGYILLNPVEQRSPSGVILPSKGELYAVCDVNHKGEFWSLLSNIDRSKTDVLIDTRAFDVDAFIGGEIY